MVTVLSRKLRRDLSRTRGLLLAIISIIAVGTGSFVGMLGTYKNLAIARDHYYSTCRMADFWVDLKKAPVEDVRRLCRIPGISEIRERIALPVIVDLEGVNEPISGQAVSMPPEKGPVINGIVIRSGCYFTPGSLNQVIVSEKFAQERHIRPGSFIHLVLNGQRKKLYVVGTAISAEHVYLCPPGGMVEEPSSYGLFYLKREYAENAFGFHGACNQVCGLLTPQGQEYVHSILMELNERLAPYGVFATTPRSEQFSNLTLDSEMSGLQTMATMLPILFLGVAALILNVLMTRLAEQQRTIVGTLKALGYGNGQVFFHFLQYGLVVGLVGGLAGCLLGYWISGAMTVMYVQYFVFPKLINYFFVNLSTISVFISLGFAVLGTLRGVKHVVQLNPAEAMRESMPAKGGNILLERWNLFWKSLNFRWQVVLRNMFRNKVRTSIAVFAAAMGCALMVLAFGFVNSMDAWTDFQFTKVMLSDYNLNLKDETDSGAVLEARRLPGVTHAEGIFSVSCTFSSRNHHKKGTILGIDRDARLTIPRDKKGNAVPVPSFGLLMCRRMAETHLHVREGDTVTFTPVKGIREPHEVPVVRIIDSMVGLGVYADFDYLNRLLSQSGTVSEVQIKAKQTSEEKTAFLSKVKQFPRLQSLDNVEHDKVLMEQQMTGSMQGMAMVMILFASVIFFGSILNGTLISISERQREIATYRVLGYTPAEIGSIFLIENVLTNMLGAVLGLLLGYWMLFAMMSQYQNDAYSFPSVLYPSSLIYSIVLSLVFVLTAHYFVKRTIRKQNWEEALSMKE